MRKFSKLQLRVLIGCFIAYFCAYIGRLNMSASLRYLIADMHISDSAGGSLQTVFAISYAAGQLVFGMLSDRFKPKRLILFGLTGTALMNGLFSVIRSFPLHVAVWTLNGLCQATLWTPIVRLLAQYFDVDERKNASFVMSFTLAAGHFAAWALAGWMARAFSWRMSYAMPAGVLLCAVGVSLMLLPQGEATKTERKREKNAADKQPMGVLLKSGLAFLLICCVTNGFVRDGVITWGPTILGSSSDDGLFDLIIPIINLLGILLGAYLVRHVRQSIKAIVSVLMAVVALPALIAFAGGGKLTVPILALLLGLMSASLYGTNPMLTTLIPMEYDWAGRVGLVAGLVDCFIYIGSACSGALIGYVHQTTGSWTSIYALWAAAAIVGALMGLLSTKRKKAE